MASFNNPVSGRLLVLLATVASIPAALYVGRLAGQGNMPKLTMILGGLFGMLVVLGMGQKIWLLIPAAFALNLPPLPFGGRQLQLEEVATAAAFGVFVISMAMHRQHLRPSRRENWAVLLYTAWVFMIFTMNPVGLSSMGSSEGGGRSYLALVVAVLSFFVVSHHTISEKQAKWIITCFLAGSVIAAGWAFLANSVLPASVAWGTGTVQTEGEYTWHQQLAAPAYMATLWLFSRWRFSEVFSAQRPWTILIVLFAILLGLASGKRAVFMATLFLPVIAAAIRRDWNVIWIGTFFATLFIVSVALGHDNLYRLPYAAQRALSFVPGMRVDSDVYNDISGEFRPALRAIAWDEIKENPWVGRKGYKIDFNVILDAVYGGVGGYGQAQTLEFRDTLTAKRFAMQGSWHTTWLGIAADFGIPAAIIFFLFYMQMIGLGFTLLRAPNIRNSAIYRTLVMMITINAIVYLFRSWTSGHSTQIAMSLWWQYGVLVALRYLPHTQQENQAPGSRAANDASQPGGYVGGLRPIAQ